MRPLHTSTLLTRKPSRIVSYINESFEKFSGKEYTFLFSLSANFDHPHELEQVVSTIRRARKGNARVVGCLSGPLCDVELPGRDRARLSCALAVFHSSHCVPFYSALHGSKEVRVGKWHSFTRDHEENLDVLGTTDGQSVNWDEVWKNRTSSSVNKHTIPEELRSISPSKIHTLLYMSIPHPELFTLSLSDYLSSSTSTSLGLLAAPTHFVTGRDVTLFSDDKIYGNGTVGLALVRSEDDKEESLPKITTNFIGLQKLGDRMVVTSVEGNMINSLDGSNPTRLLLRAIERAETPSNGLSPTFRGDEQFALAGLSPAGDILRTFKITAGDPTSRGGSISLDATEAPTQGSIVQFLRRSPDTSLTIPTSFLSSSNPSIALLTVPESNEQPSCMASDSHPLILPNTFLATSSSGFLLSQFNADPHRVPANSNREDRWSCTLPGGMAIVTYRD